MALSIRDWSARIGRSPAEIFWLMFEPSMHMLFYITVIGLFPRRPHVGDSFALFFATGLVPYFLYQRIFFRISIALNMQMLLPLGRITFIDVISSRVLVEISLWVCNLVIVYLIIILIGDNISVANYLNLIYSILLLIFLGVAWGSFSGFMVAFFSFWPKFTNFTNRCIYFSCGIFFIPDHLPPFIRDVIFWNPLLHVIEFGRSGVYYGYGSVMMDIRIPLLISLILCAGAAIIQHRAMERFQLQ